MVEIAALCAAAILMSCVYKKTKRPKLYAFLNTAAGTACLFALSAAGIAEVNSCSAALSAIFGVPGALLQLALVYLQGGYIL